MTLISDSFGLNIMKSFLDNWLLETQDSFIDFCPRMRSNAMLPFTLQIKQKLRQQKAINIRVGGSYESSLVAANILLCTLFKPKSAKKGFKKAGNHLGLGLKDLLLWLPLHSRSVNRGSPKFQHFCYKSGWTNHIAFF